MEHLVGQKGQVVIAKEIRDRLGIGPGWRAIQRIVGDHVELSFVPPRHSRSLRGALASKLRRRPVDLETEEETAMEREVDREWQVAEGDA